MKRWFEAACGLALILMAACSAEPEKGPGLVRWDRVTCERCIMAVSDRNHSAQIRGGVAGARTKLHYFDDFGCAVLWLAEQPWRDDPRTEVWVNDYRDGTWCDAFKAFYVAGMVTPMDYGLGARSDSTAGAVNYAQAVAEVHAREARLH